MSRKFLFAYGKSRENNQMELVVVWREKTCGYVRRNIFVV